MPDTQPVGTGTSKSPYALSACIASVQQAISGHMPTPVWIIAEVAAVAEKSGHYYLELIEATADQTHAKASAIIWRSDAARVLGNYESVTGLPLQRGVKLKLQVTAGVHAMFGFRLVVKNLDTEFVLGDMSQRVAAIRLKLTQQGIYTRNKQRPTPQEFTHVAVLSPDGAAGLGDFRQDADTLERLGLCKFTYSHAAFQGPRASAEIVAALHALRPQASGGLFDCVCVIRGGGSPLDLAWLNDYAMAEAICMFPIPVFTGIGHERDSVVLDEVANAKFDTPSKVIAHLRDCIKLNMQTAEGSWVTIQNLTQRVCDHAAATSGGLIEKLQHLATDRVLHATAEAVSLRTRVDAAAHDQLHRAGIDAGEYFNRIAGMSVDAINQGVRSAVDARTAIQHLSDTALTQIGTAARALYQTDILRSSTTELHRVDALAQSGMTTVLNRAAREMLSVELRDSKIFSTIFSEARTSIGKAQGRADRAYEALALKASLAAEHAAEHARHAHAAIHERTGYVLGAAVSGAHHLYQVADAAAPRHALRRGYAIVRSPAGEIIKSAGVANTTALPFLCVEFQDATLNVTKLSHQP